MNRIVLVLAICALCACGSSTSLTSSSTSRDDGTPGKQQLHREGRWLVDSLGRVVLIHGVNTVWKTPPYAPPADAKGFIDVDADWLRDHGFNGARVGTLFVGLMPSKNQIDHSYLDLWDRVVQLMTSRGVYVLFDFHQDMFNERYAGEGFPGWAVNDNGIPMPVNLGFPANYFTPACSQAFNNFWLNTDGIWESYRQAWMAVAARWKDQDHVMGYDLMNEPWPGTQVFSCMQPLGCPQFDAGFLQPMQEYAMDGIRQVDPSNVVWFEPHVIFNDGAQTNLGLLKPIRDQNIGLSWHTYCTVAGFVHAYGFSDIPGCVQQNALVADNADQAIARMGATTLITEFGASDDLADIADVTGNADAHLTGWMYWHYKEWADPTTESQTSGGQGLFTDDADLSTVKVEKLKILERAYPQATAGTPESLTFDPSTAAFHYRYAPNTASAPTEIHVPTIHYPNGYTVTVTGATVTSAPGATTLTLQNQAGATEVDVTIAPASGS
ncbi:MAG TPA: cellulase family glycosylhydrolase [Nevskiaceae bacterium]|nr:cellulase family glycosylhydrolase [Nevskiaceae bacterium]